MTTDELLDKITATKQQIKSLQITYDELLDQLTAAYEAGEVDDSFTHNDWRVTLSQGRRSWVYPPSLKLAELELKAAKKQAEGDGTAIATIGDPYWVVKEP